MSSPNPDATVASIAKYVNGPPDNNTLTKTPFTYFVMEKADKEFSVGGTKYMPKGHLYTVQSPGWWGGRNMGSFPDPVNFRAPEHAWTGIILQYMTLEWDRLINQAGDTRRWDREKEVLKAVKKNIPIFYETKFWLDNSASSPAGVIGVPGFMKASGSYGGLTQNATTHPAWTPTRVDGSSAIAGKTFATDPIAYITRAVNNHATKGSSSGLGITDRPELAFTTQAIFEFLMSYFVAKSNMPVTVNTKTAGIGFDTLRICGVDFYWSPSATSAQIQFFNVEDFKVVFQTAEKLVTRMSEPDQPIGQAIQLYNKFWWGCERPYNQLQLHTTGVT